MTVDTWDRVGYRKGERLEMTAPPFLKFFYYGKYVSTI